MIDKYGAIDTMILGKFPPAKHRNDIFIGNLANEPDAPVTVTLHQKSSPGYFEFSIFSERNVGTNLFIWFYENGTVVPIDEPFANGEIDQVDGDIDDDNDDVSQLFVPILHTFFIALFFLIFIGNQPKECDISQKEEKTKPICPQESKIANQGMIH